MRMNGAERPALARGRGRRQRLRPPGRRDPADLRRARTRHHAPARARPARAGGRPMARGLRPRLRPGRRRARDLRARSDEPRHADRRRLDGLDAARLHHRPGSHAPDRHGRVPGMRHHRDHDPDRQALVARAGRQELPQAIKSAFHVARTGRCGPVLVDMPRDVQEAEFDFALPRRGRPAGMATAARGNSKQVARRGADHRRRRSGPCCTSVAERSTPRAATSCSARGVGQLPVMTTLMAKRAFPETHELHFGWPGMHGAKWSNWAMNKADVIVAVGARFDDRVTGKVSAFAPGATVVHLDVDAAEIAKMREANVRAVGPLKPMLAELARCSRRRERPPTSRRTEPGCTQIADWREEFPLRYREEGDAPEAAASPRDAATAHGGPRRRGSGRRGSASTRCGYAVPRLRRTRAASSRRAVSARWGTGSPRPWARRRHGLTPPWCASTATAASR